jgi:hypothetical protein
MQFSGRVLTKSAQGRGFDPQHHKKRKGGREGKEIILILCKLF